ncbi:hypothetical protein Hanom_Chr15g01352851 [Helianthus anomalus]
MFVFSEKSFLATYVCVTQTKRRCLGLQTICFLEDLSLKNLCASSFWCRLGLSSSNLFSLFFLPWYHKIHWFKTQAHLFLLHHLSSTPPPPSL